MNSHSKLHHKVHITIKGEHCLIFLHSENCHSIRVFGGSFIQFSKKKLTSLHLVLERGCAIHDQLLQRHCLICQLQIEQFLHVFWMMEVQNFLVSVVASIHIVEQDVNNLLQEFACLGLRCMYVW